MSRVKTFQFGPGRLEHLTLKTWRQRDVVSARLTGEYAIYCGAGNTHWVPIDNRDAANVYSIGTFDKTICQTHQDADPGFAEAVAETLLEYALEDWFDPCQEEEDPD